MGTIKIAHAEPFSGAPKINLASVFGASPNKPFLLRIPVTGERPMTYQAKDLPAGLTLKDNIITGAVEQAGEYCVTLIAENVLGKAEKQVTLEIQENHVLLTPLLGFTTWNAFATKVTQKNVLDSAHNLVKYGISEYGYRYVNLDSGWQLEYGGEFDAIQPNPKFPDMKAMTDEIHGLGLKCGIYSTPMLTAWGCPEEYESIPGCTQGEPDVLYPAVNGGIGLTRKEKNNAKQWETWGFDYLKYDWMPTDTVNAELMRQELIQLNRDFGFCVATTILNGYAKYWTTRVNSFRSNPDSHGTWSRVVEIYGTYFPHIKDGNKGHHFDLDMLDVGSCCFKDAEDYLTEDEMVVSYSMRAFLNSPVQISADLENPTAFELDLYCNEEVIAINQDAAFAPSTPIFRYQENGARLDVFEKLLEDGTYAYGIFNMGEKTDDVRLTFTEEGEIRDVWAKESLGAHTEFSVKMRKHTVRIFKCEKQVDFVAMTVKHNMTLTNKKV